MDMVNVIAEKPSPSSDAVFLEEFCSLFSPGMLERGEAFQGTENCHLPHFQEDKAGETSLIPPSGPSSSPTVSQGHSWFPQTPLPGSLQSTHTLCPGWTCLPLLNKDTRQRKDRVSFISNIAPWQWEFLDISSVLCKSSLAPDLEVNSEEKSQTDNVLMYHLPVFILATSDDLMPPLPWLPSASLTPNLSPPLWWLLSFFPILDLMLSSWPTVFQILDRNPIIFLPEELPNHSF